MNIIDWLFSWKNIDTAPKDGSFIMLRNGPHMGAGRWVHGQGWMTRGRGLVIPTAWCRILPGTDPVLS
jgi:hypothetical protein